MFSLKDKKTARRILSEIKKNDIKSNFMHVCGTHQDTIIKNGIDSLLKDNKIEIRPGPGCPVCVTTTREIEEVLTLAKNGLVITTFGDMIQVPGEEKSLNDLKSEGCKIRTVYSIEDAVDIARKNPSEEIVFMAVGFETTAPTTAAIIDQNPPDNFSVLCCHRTMPNALKTLIDSREINIDGLIEPGHVSTIIGSKPFDFISTKYNIPQVIAGFEPLDVLAGCLMLIRQIKTKEPKIENEYTRVVKKEGNIKAKKLMKKVFKPIDIKWRGFPTIPKSGLKIKEKYQKFDARKKYENKLSCIKEQEFREPAGCLCGNILKGLNEPCDCPHFGKKCTPEKPIGPCMVSREGTCNIEYRFRK
ncbi:MAG: hydrogenase formation protein HypD [Candidatus Thermoplasmatota archaeon]